MRKPFRVLLFLALFCLPALAGPVYYQYNLAAAHVANADADLSPTDAAWMGFWGGETFQKGAVTVDVASRITGGIPPVNRDILTNVPFSIAATGNESWSAQQAWQLAKDANPATDPAANMQMNMSMNGQETAAVFLMLNTFWGAIGQPSMELTLVFRDAAPLKYTLVGDVDVRDHNDAALVLGRKIWTNLIDSHVRDSGNGGSQVAVNDKVNPVSYVYGGTTENHTVFRDVAVFFLPEQYRTKHLIGLNLLDLGRMDTLKDQGDPLASRAWLWGVTTLASQQADVPEPSTWLLMAAGLTVLGVARSRRRRERV